MQDADADADGDGDGDGDDGDDGQEDESLYYADTIESLLCRYH